MNKNPIIACVAIALFVVPFLSCRKDGMNSAEAKRIQYHWDRVSSSSATDYQNGRTVTWITSPSYPGSYLEFGSDGYFYDYYGFGGSTKYRYKVDGNKILYLAAGSSPATTPQYSDTTFINYVDDHLLVLLHRKYFSSGTYHYMDEVIDSLKK